VTALASGSSTWTGSGCARLPVNGRILARRIPHARLHIVPGGGHLFLLERPAETAALVADFLTAESPTAAPSGARGGEGGRRGACNGGR
jgi:alpha-beta hydrolase superfamily lysophospholipase